MYFNVRGGGGGGGGGGACAWHETTSGHIRMHETRSGHETTVSNITRAWKTVADRTSKYASAHSLTRRKQAVGDYSIIDLS